MKKISLFFRFCYFFNDLSDESASADKSYSERTVDSKDIEGFDKVFNFTRFIDSLPSSPITDEDAKKMTIFITNCLPLTYGQFLKSNLKGHFAGNKSGHVREQQTKQFF